MLAARQPQWIVQLALLVACFFLPLASPAAQTSTAAADDVAVAREVFKSVWKDVERGDWSAVEALPLDERAALENYVLWPDLKAAHLRAAIRKADPVVVEAFLDQYGTLKPARDLRYRYSLHLARSGRNAAYLDIYDTWYRDLEAPRLDCLALTAELALGKSYVLADRAKTLWMTGESQADECDPVFRWLADNALLTRADYEARYELAIDAREFARARWLGKSIGESHVQGAEAWQRAAANPARFVRSYRGRAETPEARQRLIYAIERETYANPEIALELWTRIKDAQPFTAAEHRQVERHIALWTARDRLPGGWVLLSAVPEPDAEVLRWRARTSLRANQWPRLILDIDAMPADESDKDEWRFWKAIALSRTGRAEAARDMFEALAAERGYYGFLAADELGRPYAFNLEPLAADELLIALLDQRPDFVRARELFYVGLDSRGRSEWDAAVLKLPAAEQEQAAILADRWGWHSRAIATVTRAAHFDDLEIRYPLPFAEHFETSAAEASIPATWAYGVARSESLFMRDVRSGAGAVGLMQLMPATGRAVAKRIDLGYNGLATLTDPAKNIRLGTSYLGQMAERFSGNRVLATAAYNAGPHRVDAWLPADEPVDTRIWIENIPFNETRGYVRRVLAAETIFHWRMTGDTRRLSSLLSTVLPAGGSDSVAAVGGDSSEVHLEQ